MKLTDNNVEGNIGSQERKWQAGNFELKISYPKNHRHAGFYNIRKASILHVRNGFHL
jgi:hypothetical protein